MKLEAALKHFSPQSMHISDTVGSTGPDRLHRYRHHGGIRHHQQ